MNVRRDSQRGVLLAILLGWLGFASDVRCEESLGDRSVHADLTHSPSLGTIITALAGQPAPPASDSTCGFSLIAGAVGPQVAVMQLANTCTVSVRKGETVDFGIPVENLALGNLQQKPMRHFQCE